MQWPAVSMNQGPRRAPFARRAAASSTRKLESASTPKRATPGAEWSGKPNISRAGRLCRFSNMPSRPLLSGLRLAWFRGSRSRRRARAYDSEMDQCEKDSSGIGGSRRSPGKIHCAWSGISARASRGDWRFQPAAFRCQWLGIMRIPRLGRHHTLASAPNGLAWPEK